MASRFQLSSRLIIQRHCSASTLLVYLPESLARLWCLCVKSFHALCCGPPSWQRVYNMEPKSQFIHSRRVFAVSAVCCSHRRRSATHGYRDQYSWESLPRLLWNGVKTDLICLVCLRERLGVMRRGERTRERQIKQELDGKSSTLTEQPGSIWDKCRGMHSE